MKCEGTERHKHFRLSTDSYITHEHPHTEQETSFNILHHHAPKEHDNFTNYELEATMQETNEKYPFA